MFRGLYISGSALMTNNRKIDVISNNIANINTTGYKKDLVLIESFEDTLISKINGDKPIENLGQVVNLKIKQVDNYYVAETEKGFFKINTPTGISYNRRAQFTVGEDGYLRTFYKNRNGEIDSSYGYQILGNKGPIYVGDGEFNINENGDVFVNGEVVDNILTKPHPLVIGTMSSGVKLERIETNFIQGQLIRTGNPLDFAIKGEGFFKIETEDGIRYTRNGSFKLNKNKELVTSEGYRVLGEYGPIILDGEKISLTPYGELMVDGEVVDKLSVVNIKNLRDLRKVGNALWKMEDNVEPVEEEFTGEIYQGKLEGSNVDPVKEMVEMMTLFRGYESNQRLIRAYDETIGKAVNDIGRV
ncbi:flagellar basal-body rod protein FlgG [Caminicella sporogenes DSM 14501]|uniref:Flagellar basal-body rod protein FlgG n=1 Tax=Caminicella sporogenes DSM 14501 TaxID=1121266 RepID=A0A1M6PV20_9FIRM|nr:flagellar hook-basal body protein [Caminicella sporogenes]RKD21961.1 flagellar biosynthesis protein FlgE [Caminicella sporogenes]SHK11767.1 flagellar basal-body rod protein FlgG [Caminicella sporogenes DSM 14501]